MFETIDCGIIVLVLGSILSMGMLLAALLYCLKAKKQKDKQAIQKDEELYKIYGGD